MRRRRSVLRTPRKAPRRIRPEASSSLGGGGGWKGLGLGLGFFVLGAGVCFGHLQCCNWLQVQLLQQGGDVDGPGVASRPPHDEAQRQRVAGILEREDNRKMCSGGVPATFWQLSMLQSGTPPKQVAARSPEQVPGENATQLSGPIGPYGMRESGIPALACPRSPSDRPGLLQLRGRRLLPLHEDVSHNVQSVALHVRLALHAEGTRAQ